MSRLVLSKILALAVGTFCVYLAYDHNKHATYEVNGSIYGTYWRLVSTEYISDNLQQSISKELSRIDAIASHYKNLSELSNINSAPLNTKIKISSELFHLLSFAEYLYVQSSGYYDVTIGSAVINNGFGPEPSELANIDPISKKRFSLLDGQYLEKYNKFLFDLSSIAKGYAVDSISNLLKVNNKDNFIFDIGGELIASGSKHGEPWLIGIQDPSAKKNQSIFKILSNNFLAVATSGEYRNSLINSKGQVVSHSINPFTGHSIQNNVLSVTVTSEVSNMEADAWATALNVMGPTKGIPVANEHQISVLYIINNNNEIEYIKSNSWAY